MMGPRQVQQGALFYKFSLDGHVPADHLLRSVDRFVDLAGLRREPAPFYSETGRPSVDPELMIRMLIVGYCFGIRSERRLCDEVHPKDVEVKSAAAMGKLTISVARAAAQDTEVTKNAPAGTNILRMDGDAASVQAVISGQAQAVGGNIFYIRRLEDAKPGVFEQKLVFSNIYNGACTRLGEKEISDCINTFIDKIKASGELKAITDRWMKAAQPPMPEKLDGVPFTVS